MIRINLLGEESAPDTSGIVQLIVFGTVQGVALLVCFLLYTAIAGELRDVKQEVESRELELQNLMKTTQEVRELEKKKTELRDMLKVIALLNKKRVGPVRVLDDLNLAIPEKAWLKSVKEDKGSFTITGLALDNQTVARFMKALEGSDFYSDIELVESKGAAYQGVAMKEFSVKAKVLYGGKSQLAEEKRKAQEESKSEGSKGSKSPAKQPSKEDEA